MSISGFFSGFLEGIGVYQPEFEAENEEFIAAAETRGESAVKGASMEFSPEGEIKGMKLHPDVVAKVDMPPSSRDDYPGPRVPRNQDDYPGPRDPDYYPGPWVPRDQRPRYPNTDGWEWRDNLGPSYWGSFTDAFAESISVVINPFASKRTYDRDEFRPSPSDSRHDLESKRDLNMRAAGGEISMEIALPDRESEAVEYLSNVGVADTYLQDKHR